MTPLRKPREILQSKRGNFEYLEHCRVKVKNGRVVYLQANSGESVDSYWSIPIANTTVVLLGTGTSITQQAVAKLGEAGVMLGFCGTGGTPLHAGVEVEWINPQMEYRPTEYVQAWLSFWFDDTKRLGAAKLLQHRRLQFLRRAWTADALLKQHRIYADDRNVDSAIRKAIHRVDSAEDVTTLLLGEAELTKRLYAYVANAVHVDGFKRVPQGSDPANRFLTHGNYLAYGQAASCLCVSEFRMVSPSCTEKPAKERSCSTWPM